MRMGCVGMGNGRVMRKKGNDVLTKALDLRVVGRRVRLKITKRQVEYKLMKIG